MACSQKRFVSVTAPARDPSQWPYAQETVIASNGVLYLQIRSVRSHSRSGMKEGMKEWNEGVEWRKEWRKLCGKALKTSVNCDIFYLCTWSLGLQLKKCYASPECSASHVCRLMIRVIMSWSRGLGTGLLAVALWLWKTLEATARRPFEKGCMTSHRLKCGLLSPNEVCRIAQHFREREGRNEGKDRIRL